MEIMRVRNVPNSRLKFAGVVALGAMAAPAGPAASQSFSCAKAERPAEFAICNNENLLVLDEHMAKLHAAHRLGFTGRIQLRHFTRESLEWLKKRDACKQDFACLKSRYRERIELLSGKPL